MTEGPYDYARERYEAERDALRRGIGPGSRPPQDGEDVPTHAEAEADEA
jgi:hypothetical protein